jgi:hypothetical protein
MFVLLIWILSAILGAAMLSRYNKAGSGFLLGFLLGPVGLLFALVIRSGAKADEERKRHEEDRSRPLEESEALLRAAAGTPLDASGSDTVECPRCAENIKSKAKICRFCQYEIPEQPLAEPGVPSTAPEAVKTPEGIQH